MEEEEVPLVCIDHRIYRDEPKVVIGIFDLAEIPVKIKFSIHMMRGFDEVLREFRRPPSKWLNHWLKLDYLEDPIPILFDEGGHPYVMAPAKHQETAPLLNAIVADLKGRKPIEVKIYIREKDAEDVLERLETATDFCDHCGGPLKTSGADDGLMYSSGGGTIASIFNCPSCERETIRWDASFLEEHPEMGEQRTR